MSRPVNVLVPTVTARGIVNVSAVVAMDAARRAAWVQLMRVAHPDGGGSHGLASRVNQARDVLLKGR